MEEGSLYPALHRLDKAGFIDAEWTVTPNGRRARVYRLTKPGRKRLKEIEESWATLDRRRAEGVAMGVKGGWFRRRPSDDEMREELEAHVAMRAEHDRVDEAAARRRLGNLLHTRESMRRVWIAEWWDALRQDAHFTWRSWRRRPGFALAAILVLGLGLGASTALFAALDRVLFRPLPYADPDRLVSVGLLTARPGRAGPDRERCPTRATCRCGTRRRRRSSR